MRASIYAAVLLAVPGLASAASLSATLGGASLSVDSPCAIQIDITPDPALHDQAVVQATADDQGELDHLLLDSQGAARIRTHPGRCWQREPGANATLRLSVRVPAGFAVGIDESGVGHYNVGPVGGAFSVDLSGSADVAAAAVTQLTVDLSGNGNVQVAQADGPARIDLSGHGRVTVAHATMQHLSANLSGAGQVTVSAGRIDKLALDASGVGSTNIGAEVGDAHVDLSGVGSVRFASVTGRLDKDVSGVGSVTVGR